MSAGIRRIGGHEIELSSLGKVYFPDDGLTKGDLIDHYDRVAPQLLRHAAGRIVTMHRYPDGIDGKDFYQKNVPDHFPAWIPTTEVEKEDGTLRQVVLEDRATLLYLADQGCIPVHVWPSRADRRKHPDRLVFDLDPSDDHVAAVRAAARTLRNLLEDVGVVPFVMTSGSRGFHVVVPLNGEWDFDRVRTFARKAAEVAVARDPGLTLEQRKSKREGRIFVDVLRNAYAQHSIAPYGVRALPGAPVATPIDWDELGDTEPRSHTIRTVHRRLAQKDDPWKGMGRRARSLDGPMEAVRAALADEG